MESNSTHQVATEGAGGSSPTVITIPRWIEARDRRPGAERFDPSRSRYYVVSPALSPDDANTLASAYAQRERLERAHLALERIQTPVLIGVMVALVFLIVQEYSYWTLMLPALVFVGHQFMYQDAANDLRKPFDTNALEEHAESRMFHRIPVNEYQAATRIAKSHDAKSSEVHQFMWRAYELQALYIRTQDEFHRIVATQDLTEAEIRSIHAKLSALQELARDAHQALYGVLNPRRHVLPTGREGLLELVHRVDAALHEGITDLGGRVDEANAQLKAAKEARDKERIEAGLSPFSASSAPESSSAKTPDATEQAAKMVKAAAPRHNAADQLLRETMDTTDSAPITTADSIYAMMTNAHSDALMVQDSQGYAAQPQQRVHAPGSVTAETAFKPIERWFPNGDSQSPGGAVAPVGSATTRGIAPAYDVPKINEEQRRGKLS